MDLATYVDSPILQDLPAIPQGQDWSFTFQLFQPDAAILGGSGADGIVTFDGISTPPGTSRLGSQYTLLRNVQYSQATFPSDAIIYTNGFTISTQVAMNPDGGVLLKVLDLTGSNFQCSLKQFYSDTTPLYSTTPVVAANVVTIPIPRAITATLTQKQLYYDIFWSDSHSVRTMIFTGKVPVIQAVS